MIFRRYYLYIFNFTPKSSIIIVKIYIKLELKKYLEIKREPYKFDIGKILIYNFYKLAREFGKRAKSGF